MQKDFTLKDGLTVYIQEQPQYKFDILGTVFSKSGDYYSLFRVPTCHYYAIYKAVSNAAKIIRKL